LEKKKRFFLRLGAFSVPLLVVPFSEGEFDSLEKRGKEAPFPFS